MTSDADLGRLPVPDHRSASNGVARHRGWNRTCLFALGKSRSRHILMPQLRLFRPVTQGAGKGRSSMGFFTTRERDALGKPPADIPAQGKVRELVRPDLMPRRRPPERNLADQLGSLMQRVADTSVHTIDNLILDMQQRREELLNESARMQREIIEYA